MGSTKVGKTTVFLSQGQVEHKHAMETEISAIDKHFHVCMCMQLYKSTIQSIGLYGYPLSCCSYFFS